MPERNDASHRHAVVLAGGSGTRLWPLSRGDEPKQLITIKDGRSLLELALERLDGVVAAPARWVCAGERHRSAVTRRVPGLPLRQYLGEPEARDTLAALAFSASVIRGKDADAVIGVFTADHLIRPVERFREIVAAGFDLAAADPQAVVTFGIIPTSPATGYGYLELAEDLGGGARRVSRFREKPDPATAMGFVAAGPARYLWNSGMFVFRAATFLERLACYAPLLATAMHEVAAAWNTPREEPVLRATYAGLRKISFDYGFMEPASVDPGLHVAAIPMPLEWLDIGSWPAFASMFPADPAGNTATAERALLEGCSGTLVVSDDPQHLVAALGCDDLVVVHTARATLVCPRDRSEDIKKLQTLVAERFGPGYV
jgi:mannose-1-phosphate guanylyltransferase